MKSAQEIVESMMSSDRLSQWLGIDVLEIRPGFAKISMIVRSEMVNGFDIAHGGITYSLSDSALAFASNSHGPKCMSIETSISHTKAVHVGDHLTAICEELHCGKTIGIYETRVFNQEGKTVSLFKGTVIRSKE